MIHSERDLFSSVAFFAKKKKRAEQKDLCEVTSFFFFFTLPPENLIWCYSVAGGTAAVHSVYSALGRRFAPNYHPKKVSSNERFNLYISCFSSPLSS